MSTPATHPCDACDGSGAAIWLSNTFWLVEHIRRKTCSGCQWCDVGRCPICLGAGSFPDRMPARDALADAETLRLYCLLVVSPETPYDLDALVVADLVLDCHMSGLLNDSPGRREWGHIHAQDAARAAFRAVPGLRG